MSEAKPLDGSRQSPETHRVNVGGHPTGEKLVTGQPLEDQPCDPGAAAAEEERQVQAEEERAEATLGKSGEKRPG